MTPGIIGTMVVFCFFSLITGQGLADTWRPKWQIVMYGILLSLGARLSMLILFARHIGGLASEVAEFAVLAAVIAGCTALAFRITRARKMVTQYPWLYERHGLLSWRAKRQDTADVAEKTG